MLQLYVAGVVSIVGLWLVLTYLWPSTADAAFQLECARLRAELHRGIARGVLDPAHHAVQSSERLLVGLSAMAEQISLPLLLAVMLVKRPNAVTTDVPVASSKRARELLASVAKAEEVAVSTLLLRKSPLLRAGAGLWRMFLWSWRTYVRARRPQHATRSQATIFSVPTGEFAITVMVPYYLPQSLRRSVHVIESAALERACVG